MDPVTDKTDYGGGQQRQWNNNPTQNQSNAKMDTNTIKEERWPMLLQRKQDLCLCKCTNPSPGAPSIGEPGTDWIHNTWTVYAFMSIPAMSSSRPASHRYPSLWAIILVTIFAQDSGFSSGYATIAIEGFAKGLDIHTKFFEMHVNAVETQAPHTP